jgi:hypothetical protein
VCVFVAEAQKERKKERERENEKGDEGLAVNAYRQGDLGGR